MPWCAQPYFNWHFSSLWRPSIGWFKFETVWIGSNFKSSSNRPQFQSNAAEKYCRAPLACRVHHIATWRCTRQGLEPHPTLLYKAPPPPWIPFFIFDHWQAASPPLLSRSMVKVGMPPPLSLFSPKCLHRRWPRPHPELLCARSHRPRRSERCQKRRRCPLLPVSTRDPTTAKWSHHCLLLVVASTRCLTTGRS
jgi:hypothetical protein